MFISDRQKKLTEAINGIVAEYGEFDQSDGADGAHYGDADENPFKEDGLICGNCVAYLGLRRCDWVSGDIDPNGICKLWQIPEEVLSEYSEEEKKGYEQEEEGYEEGEDEEEMVNLEDVYAYEMNKSAELYPPERVRAEAHKVVIWASQHDLGVPVVVQKRAESIAAGEPISVETLRKMRPFLESHNRDGRTAGWTAGVEGFPNPSRVAFSAWGGKAALDWLKSLEGENG